MVGRWTNFVTRFHDKTPWLVGEHISWQNVTINQHGKEVNKFVTKCYDKTGW